MKAYRERLALGIAILLWASAIALGARELWHYSQTPGKLAAAPEMWPAAVHGREEGKPTLVLFLHPECPCSRATVTELSRVLTRTPQDLIVIAYFLQPEDEQWTAESSSLWNEISRLPGVREERDLNGLLARLFGAETSGTTLLYDNAGRLRFRGGITSGRGHEGENPSEEALLAGFKDTETVPISTHVFGCSLF
ncbi:RedB protein [Verrucomicrobiota bacterium sgz303538]